MSLRLIRYRKRPRKAAGEVARHEIQEARAADLGLPVLRRDEEERRERHGLPRHHEEVGVIGEEDRLQVQPLQAIPGVEQVLPILKPFKLASREFRKTNTVVVPANVSGVAGMIATAMKVFGSTGMPPLQPVPPPRNAPPPPPRPAPPR